MMPLMTLLKLSSPYTLLFVASIFGWVTALQKFKPIYLLYAGIYDVLVLVSTWILSTVYFYGVDLVYKVFGTDFPPSMDQVSNMGTLAAGANLAALVFLIPLSIFVAILSLYFIYYYLPRYILVRIAKREASSQ